MQVRKINREKGYSLPMYVCSWKGRQGKVAHLNSVNRFHSPGNSQACLRESLRADLRHVGKKQFAQFRYIRNTFWFDFLIELQDASSLDSRALLNDCTQTTILL